jgi:hypothetical protein
VPQGSADVNAHIKDRIRTIAADVGQLVKLAYHHRNIRLQEARADDDERKCGPEYVDRWIILTAGAFDGHKAVPYGKQDTAEQHGLALTQITVGQIASENGGDVHKAGIGTVDQVRFGIRKQPVLRQIENENSAHAIIGKTLPHFGEKQHVQALGMACEFRFALDGNLGPHREKNAQYDDSDSRYPVALGP